MTQDVPSDTEKTTVAAWSLAASVALTIAKFIAAAASGSLGLLSEAFHSLLDSAATALTLFAVRYAGKPADEDHHFGHAKMESVAALIETGLLFAVTGWIVYEAISRLLVDSHAIELSWWIFAVVIASIVIDWNRSRALQRTADKTESEALAADALHFRADMWSSSAVLIGLILSYAGFPQADPLAALVVALFVARAAWHLGKRTLATLLDTAPAGITSQILDLAQETDGVLSVSQIRVRPGGPTLFVDLTIDVARTLTLNQMTTIKQAVLQRLKGLHPTADAHIVTNPVELDDETAHEKIMLTAAQHRAAIHHVTVQENAGRLAVSFDFEVDGATGLAAAHDQATLLEGEIREGLGGDVEVESHIEPRPPSLLHGKELPAKTLKAVSAVLTELAHGEALMSDLHNIRIRSTEEGLFIHYHCRFAPETSVRLVHEVIDRVENKLTSRIRNVARVVAHAEPVGRAKHGL